MQISRAQQDSFTAGSLGSGNAIGRHEEFKLAKGYILDDVRGYETCCCTSWSSILLETGSTGSGAPR